MLLASVAASIALRGMLVPLIVRVVEDGYELVAGYHRIAASRMLGLTDAPVDHEGSSANSAAESVNRTALRLGKKSGTGKPGEQK